MRYVIGLIFIALGIGMIWKTDALIRAFGRIEWAEMKLGGAGTWTFYKIFGVVIIILGFIIMSGDVFRILDSLLPG